MRKRIKGKYDCLVEFGSTAGGTCAYHVDLFDAPVVATIEYSTQSLALFDNRDWLANFGNRVEKCTLGTKPAELQSIQASKFCEDPVEESTTIRLDAQLNYVGDCHVDISCTVGSLVLTQLQVTGEIVIELVRLQKHPPWFSGVRIYFSNRPKIDLVVQTEVLGLNANFEFIKQKLVTALGDVIASQTVLPNRFCIPIADAISEVDLRTPTPQGVVRLVVVEARGLPDPGRSHWHNVLRPFLGSRGVPEGPDVHPFVEVAIGAQVQRTEVVNGSLSPKWEHGNCFDFVVDDIKRQEVEFAVHDSDTGTFKWKATVLGCGGSKLAALLEGQRTENQLPGAWIRLVTGPGKLIPAGQLQVRAEWRPLQQGRTAGPVDAPASIYVQPCSGLWTVGPSSQSEWVLVADVLSATALPGDSNGQKHRVSLSLLWEGADTGRQSSTGLALAESPLALGGQMIGNMNLRPEIGEVLRNHPERIYALWRAKVPIDPKAERLERGYLFPKASKGDLISQACIHGPYGAYQPMFVDAVWNCTCQLLLDSVPAMTLRLAVSEHGSDAVVGLACYALDQLLEAPGWRFEGLLPLRRVGKVQNSPDDFCAALRVRLRLHQLETPPAHGAANAPATKLSRTGSQWFDAVGDQLDSWRHTLTKSFSHLDTKVPDEAAANHPSTGSAPHFLAMPPPRRPADMPDHGNFRSRRFVPQASVRRLGTDELEFHEALEPDSAEMLGLRGGVCL
ncbi:esyt3 [Symbiodinium natans]|uniref:Esyt3 protein n=1 Tax=Symbiodinium natans TaxID=878477 RepID=A0A812V2F3_9DINO|nr:esyt3 [Symbiodinium natans]